MTFRAARFFPLPGGAFFFLVLAQVFLAVFASCSRSAPEIRFGFIELVYYQDTGEGGNRGGRPFERYSFFVIPEHDDGIEDLSELYLYHDREGLRWKISSGDWVQYEENGKTWIGSRAIAMNGDENLPRGMYRAELFSKGGEHSERTFTFDAPEEPYPFPSFFAGGGEYRIDSQYPVNRLVLYDGEGGYVNTIVPGERSGPLFSLDLPGSVRSAALWAEDPEYRTSAFTAVVPVR
ncbi:MAG: hypothetical protein LBK08_07215 [Treponema sp.]|nr:hypothetical protein [Treponema sp.]